MTELFTQDTMNYFTHYGRGYNMNTTREKILYGFGAVIFSLAIYPVANSLNICEGRFGCLLLALMGAITMISGLREI